MLARPQFLFNLHLRCPTLPLPASFAGLYNVFPMKRASLHTIGCRLNQAETAALESRLRKAGYEIVDLGEPTDLLVLNSCSVTEDAERTCRYLIRKTLRQSPEAFVAVTGCYAQTGVHELRKIPGIDLIVGNQFKEDLPSFLPASTHLKKAPAAEVLYSRSIDRGDFVTAEYGEPDSTRVPVKIQDGCNVMCSFCLIPFARGRERSRVVEDVLQEARALVARGYREVVLTGVNVGQYRQGGRDLLALIRELELVGGLDRIRISSIEPTTVTDGLLAHMGASAKLCPYLHIPLQSGDDKVLTAMNRPYGVAEYVRLIERAVRWIPDLGLGTDLMVGFPGESEEAFQKTLSLAQDLPFAYFHVFPYSPRPGTAALKLPHPVPAGVTLERTKRLSECARVKRMAFAERYLGSTVPVLFESGRIDGFQVGTTPNFLRVAVPCSSELTNTIRPVVLSGLSNRWAVGRLSPADHVLSSAPVMRVATL
ncbi:MAG TPA: tRNA (N(6)-L-threonylcarbamoyladenosine(37)-C(2))-methylthiotransferase MtaB [Nitrospira sp.]|nr:tRNA (N(6)-L-threonylcarbamoyladenosine(37)-C(2))-methylthiotransferase MtaB [Nitrospira sp.]